MSSVVVVINVPPAGADLARARGEGEDVVTQVGPSSERAGFALLFAQHAAAIVSGIMYKEPENKIRRRKRVPRSILSLPEKIRSKGILCTDKIDG